MTANNRRLPLLALILASAAVIAPAQATILKQASFDEKVENAAAIVLGKVVRQESRFDDAHRFILTYTTFQIEKSYKGLPGEQQITLVTPGGTVDGIHQNTIGVPDFTSGGEHVVFIRNSSAGPTVLYWEQGSYEVRPDERGTRTILPMQSEAVQVDTQRGMAVGSETPRTERQFEQAVRDSERHTALNRMELIRQQREKEASLSAVLQRNKLLIALALLGIALASWRFLRR